MLLLFSLLLHSCVLSFFSRFLVVLCFISRTEVGRSGLNSFVMASASASRLDQASVWTPIETASASQQDLEREVKDLTQRKVRLSSRAQAAELTDVERAAALKDCIADLEYARQLLLLKETTMGELARRLPMVSTMVQLRQEPELAPVSHALYRSLRPKTLVVIPSPTTEAALLKAPFGHFMPETPLTIETDLTSEYYKSFGKRPDEYTAGLEAAYVEKCVDYLPKGTVKVGNSGASGKMTAKRLYPARGGRNPPFVRLPWNCYPELAVRSERGYPGFNGELKSLPPVAWDEALTYVCISMMDSLFPVSEGYDVYHFQPPRGYSLLAVAANGFFAVVEWVARLYITPLTNPFTLGSAQHKAAVNQLEMTKVEEWIELDVRQACMSSMRPENAPEGEAQFVWSTSPAELLVKSEAGVVKQLGNQFFKIITYKAFGHLGDHVAAHQFRHLHRVYAKYTQMFTGASGGGAGQLPRALVSAQLLYGAFSVLVHMPFVRGRLATDKELDEDGPVLRQVAVAMAWLARRGLLYCDVRAPNVIVTGEDGGAVAHLVDYDDMAIVASGTVGSADALVQKFREDAKSRDVPDISGEVAGRPALCRLLDPLLKVSVAEEE